jgi:hypothetical protein
MSKPSMTPTRAALTIASTMPTSISKIWTRSCKMRRMSV